MPPTGAEGSLASRTEARPAAGTCLPWAGVEVARSGRTPRPGPARAGPFRWPESTCGALGLAAFAERTKPLTAGSRPPAERPSLAKAWPFAEVRSLAVTGGAVRSRRARSPPAVWLPLATAGVRGGPTILALAGPALPWFARSETTGARSARSRAAGSATAAGAKPA
jgi:hypothetical protein